MWHLYFYRDYSLHGTFTVQYVTQLSDTPVAKQKYGKLYFIYIIRHDIFLTLKHVIIVKQIKKETKSMVKRTKTLINKTNLFPIWLSYTCSQWYKGGVHIC